MKHAIACLAVALHGLTAVLLTAGLAALAWAASDLTLDLLVAAAVLAARHKPEKPHKVITALIGAKPATWITGHTPTPAPAPADGPQIPAN
jgi:hypothetical protein